MIYLYCNVGGHHGMGHVRRMHALAIALSHYEPIDSICYVTQTTHAMKSLVSPFTCRDIEEVRGYINKEDSIYIEDCKEPYFSDATIEAMASNGTKTVAIDNPQVQQGWTMVVAPCHHWETRQVIRLRERWGKRFLYGWPYVLIPPSVTVTKPLSYRARTASHMLVYGGSGDTLDIVNRMATWIETSQTNIPVDRIYSHGRMSPWARQAPVFKDAQAHAYYSSELLRHASLAVGMMGQTVYEALYYKVPVFMVAHTEENYRGALLLSERCPGAAEVLGIIYDENEKSFLSSTFCKRIEAFYLDKEGEMMAANIPHIDGDGARRIAEAILAL